MPDYTNPYGTHTVRLSHGNWTQCADGGLIVHGPVEVDHCEVNRPGKSEADYVGDTRQLEVGDGAVSFMLKDGTFNRDDYWIGGPSGRSVNAEAIAIACVQEDWPTEGVFRPPAVGRRGNPVIEWFRHQPAYHHQVRLDRLPTSLPLPANWTVAQAIEHLNRVARRFFPYPGDVFSNWSTDERTPNLQHQGYGNYLQSDLSQLLPALCWPIPAECKRDAAFAIVQRAIDYIGCWADGRTNQYVDGGHQFGRWAQMLVGAWLLDLREIIYPDDLLASRLVERQAFYNRRNAWWYGCPYGWRRGWNDDNFLQKHPQLWTRTQRGNVWAITGYLEHVLGAQVGTVLAMKHMGLTRSYGRDLCGLVEEWMQSMWPGVEDALRDNGCGSVADAWGTSYEVSGPAQFAARIWRGESIQ